MNKKVYSFSFLVEFLFVLGFFLIASTICIKVYSYSVIKNQEANEMKKCIQYAQNYIELHNYKVESFDVDENFQRNQTAYYHVEVKEEKKDYEYYCIGIYKKDICMVELPFYKEVLDEK